MNISISTTQKEWTDFEKSEWSIADREHYGQVVNWEKKEFLLSAKHDAETVGTLRLEVQAGVAYVVSVIVTKSQRKAGVGKKLMLTAEKVVQKHGAHKIYLQTGKEWDSVDFYKNLGYRVSSELPNHYCHVDFIEMTKFF